jgi:predicted DNA-binding transcriptional regulator AlpA
MFDGLLVTTEVAAVTRAPESTVRYWRHLGTGPKSFKLGRRVVYREKDVLDWIDARAAADTSAGTAA